MIKNLFKFVLLGGILSLVSCAKNDTVTPTESANAGPYQKGFFVINEGWFGTESSDLNYYPYGSDTMQTYVYAKANNGTVVGSKTSTLEFGTIYNHDLYLCVKVGGDFIKTDESTLVEKGRISGKDWRAFVGIDKSNGLVSTSNGVFKVDLNAFAIGDTITSIPTKEIGEMLNTDQYILAASSSGTYIVKKSDWSLTKTYTNILQGFVKISNGKIFGESKTGLVQIDPNTLDTTSITLPEAPVYNPWAWTPSSITAAEAKNEVYIAASTNKIYKYSYGNSSSISTPFITLPDGSYFYGSAIRYDKQNDQIIAIATTSQWGNDTNFLYFYNATTGNLDKTIKYAHYFFPATIVFHN